MSRPVHAGPVAGLPMYDWPEVHGAVDALWAAIGGRLREAEIGAPEGVWRPDRSEDLWTHPDLLIVETCGYQIVNELRGRVEVLGVLDRGVEGCEPGDYRSVLICRDDDPAVGLADFRGRTVAFNGHRSQSRHRALAAVIALHALDRRVVSG